MVSVGGAVGGIFVAFVAPRVFRNYLELQVGLAACAILAVIVLWNVARPGVWTWVLRSAMVIAAGVLAGYLIRSEREETKDFRLMARNSLRRPACARSARKRI